MSVVTVVVIVVVAAVTAVAAVAVNQVDAWEHHSSGGAAVVRSFDGNIPPG